MQIDQAIAMMRALPAYAQLNAANNTITFTSKAASVLVIATMPEEAANLTGLQPPKYANGDVFVIYGLINPTLVFQKGATLNLTVVNLDNDMFHNFVLTSLSPPYSYMMMASGGMGPGMMYRFFSTMPLMAPASYQQGYAHVYSYDLTLGSTGTFWYACTYPGHAQSGMYGVIVTR
jgi:rusticyanin